MTRFFSLLFFCLTIGTAFSQTLISGKVTYKNKGIKEVSISIKDSYDGATSDANGNFSFHTSEKGNQVLVFKANDFDTLEKPIDIGTEPIQLEIALKERINEIERVVISAGSIEASDKNRATAILKPLDIYTIAGADAEITRALNYLPGVQKVGESDGLFVRGGTGSETKIFMDGSLINNYFTSSVPGIAGRDRFNTSLFKGNIFSSGGYSALYGQALSGVLLLESIDFPERSSYDFGISPIFISGNYQKVNDAKTQSFGGQASYSNLGLMQKLLPFNTNFIKTPESFSANINFRVKTPSGGMIKYYGSYDANVMKVQNNFSEPGVDALQFGVKGQNTYHNLSFRQKLGSYLLTLGSSYSYNKSDMTMAQYFQNSELNSIPMNSSGNYLNLKAVLERKIGIISTVRGGIEANLSSEDQSAFGFSNHYKDFLTALFAETDLGLSNHFSTKIGLRTENSSYLNQWNLAPRLALAYRLNKSWTTSVAYGLFYQNPESKYLFSPVNLQYQKAEHYIFQLQKSENNRTLRLEAFYKKYNHLLKTQGDLYQQSAVSSLGKGFAKGIELFWKDSKTFSNFDYWVSYSYLDTQRDFLNYPVSLVPNFAAKHTLNLVTKKFVTPWKTGFNLSYSYSSGRPYYDIISQNGTNILRNEGTLKDYSALNFSVNYLPNLGKKEAKAFWVLVVSVSNILGNKNIYGYNFSSTGQASAILPPVNTFVFVGAFLSFGQDKTQEAINNNL